MTTKWVYIGWADMGGIVELDSDDPLLQEPPETASPPYFIIGDSSGLAFQPQKVRHGDPLPGMSQTAPPHEDQRKAG